MRSLFFGSAVFLLMSAPLFAGEGVSQKELKEMPQRPLYSRDLKDQFWHKNH